MGWRSVLRAMERSARQAKREQLKRQRESAKTQLITASEKAVGNLHDHISDIVSVHRSAQSLVDWSLIKENSQPRFLKKPLQKERIAAIAVEKFQPSIFDLFYGGTQSRLVRLKQSHKSSIEVVENIKRKYHKELTEWEKDPCSINRAFKGEVAALKDLMGGMKHLSNDSRLGKFISFEIRNSYVHATPIVHSTDIVPRVRRKKLASGRLSETKMPDAEFYAIYQDYVCSVAFRIGAELFNAVPLDKVFVTCSSDVLDTSTGNIENVAILSVQFNRDTFESLNISSIDPSDALRNFRHNIIFKRSKGFEKISPLTII